MNVEERLAALEERVRAAEDELEITRLLTSYGPLVDSGQSKAASELWIESGSYDVGGRAKWTPKQLEEMYDGEGHQALIHTGSSHLTATPRVTLDGDKAEAVAYSFVMLKEGERWYVWRAAMNHWNLVRTAQGWRIKERFNRVLDGSTESHDVMRRMKI
jgi:hypothetical protein